MAKIYVKALVPVGKPRRMSRVQYLCAYKGEVYDCLHYYYHEVADCWPHDHAMGEKRFPGSRSTMVQPVEDRWVEMEVPS